MGETSPINEQSTVDYNITMVLEKFEGDAIPENLVEKIYIEDGSVVKTEHFSEGGLVGTDYH